MGQTTDGGRVTLDEAKAVAGYDTPNKSELSKEEHYEQCIKPGLKSGREGRRERGEPEERGDGMPVGSPPPQEI